jgi:hypothetical protein
MVTIDHNFMFGCRAAIADMQRAGMNDILIACGLVEVRAAAIREERMRLEALLRAHPPEHLPSGYYAEAIARMREP